MSRTFKYVFIVLIGCQLAFADGFRKKAQYWPFLENGYSTYHSDAYRSDSTDIEPALRYKVDSIRGPSTLAFVSANLDYDLGLSVFPIFNTPKDPKFYSFYESGPKEGRLNWNDQTAGLSVDNCSIPWSSTIDADHNNYFTDCKYLYSLTSAGMLRWKTPLPRTGNQMVTFIEVFFTPQGDVGGVSNYGVAALYDRKTGAQKMKFQLPNVDGVEKPVTQAILNAPASMLDPINPAITRVFVTGTLAQDPDKDGVKDLGLYRFDISYKGQIPSAKLIYTTVIADGATSATTPTISPNGKEVYISDKTSNKLFGIATDTGRVLWSVYVGHQQGSVATSRAEKNLVFTGAGNRELAIVNPANPSKPILKNFRGMANRYIADKPGILRDAIISTNILATPTKLLFVVTLGYDTSTDGQQGFVWPVKAFLVTTDHGGNTVSENQIPTTSDITLSIQPDGTIFVPSGDIQARIALMNAKKDPEKYSIYGEAIKMLGGVVVLKPY